MKEERPKYCICIINRGLLAEQRNTDKTLNVVQARGLLFVGDLSIFCKFKPNLLYTFLGKKKRVKSYNFSH